MNSGCPLFSLLPLPAFTLSALQTARSRSRLLPSNPSLLLFIRQKKEGCCPLVFWRRERDSNPRKLSLQRFSRPPHSTALPSLHIFIFSQTALCCSKSLLYAVRKPSLHTSDAIKIAITSLRSLQDPPLLSATLFCLLLKRCCETTMRRTT